MKKNVVLVMVLAVVLLVTVQLVRGTSSDDYKVIKNAVRAHDSSGDVAWFRLEVTDKKSDKASVKIKIPIALVDLVADSIGEDIKIKDDKGDKCDLDLKKLIKVLKSSGPMTLIEVDDADALVKIWFE